MIKCVVFRSHVNPKNSGSFSFIQAFKKNLKRKINPKLNIYKLANRYKSN